MLSKTEAFNIIVQALSDLIASQPQTMGRAIQYYLQPALQALDPALETKPVDPPPEQPDAQ